MARDARNEQIKIGDIVEGVHHGVKFRGEVTIWDFADGGCYVNVCLESPITIYNSERTEVYSQETQTWTVVARRAQAPKTACSQWGAKAA